MKNISVLILAIILIQFCMPATASRLFNEKYYQTEWCNRWSGQIEYKLKDKTRVDCLTKNYATEFDFAPKWAEAVGQSLYYAQCTGKHPAIILIIEKPGDFKYYNRLKPLAERHGIKLWYVKGVFYKTNGKALIDFLLNQKF